MISPPAQEPRDGLGWGLWIHRNVPTADWRKALETMVPEEHRPRAEEYLRGIAERMRVQRRMRRAG